MAVLVGYMQEARPYGGVPLVGGVLHVAGEASPPILEGGVEDADVIRGGRTLAGDELNVDDPPDWSQRQWVDTSDGKADGPTYATSQSQPF